MHLDESRGLTRRQALVLAGIGAGMAGTASLWQSVAAHAAPVLIYPTSSRDVSDDFADHKARNPPSQRPGTDYFAPTGTPIWSAAAGTVVSVDRNNGGGEGRWLSIDHGGGWRTEYLHFQSIYSNIVAGMTLSAGTNLGTMGGSAEGSDTFHGSHLHISLKSGSTYVDFEDYVAGGSGGDMPDYKITNRSVATPVAAVMDPISPTAMWQRLPYTDATAADNLAELSGTSTAIVAYNFTFTLRVSGLFTGESLAIRIAHWSIAGSTTSASTYTGLTPLVLEGTSSGVVDAQYVMSTKIQKQYFRIPLQVASTAPGVTVDWWQSSILAW